MTDRGARLPLPRKSYYTEAYCRRHRRRFRTTVQLAAAMLGELRVPEDVDVVVVFDSAFDAGVIHRVCRRRHADNLRVTKTKRRYAVEARPATVSKLGDCLIVASYKENPKVRLQPDQSAEWWAYHQAPVSYRREVRWQVELFFRELKSRMQFECYVLMKFEAVERYLDLLLMGLLLLEQQRLRDMQRAGGKVGAVWVQARTTDRLRMLEVLCQRWNVQCLARRLRTPGGTRRVLRDLVRQAPCQLA